MRIAIRVVVDVDAQAWRDEYGESTATAEDIRQHITHGTTDAIRAAWGHITPEVVRSVEEKF